MTPTSEQPRVDRSRPTFSTVSASTVPARSSLRLLRWLAVPAVVALLIMVGLSTTATERGSSSRDDDSASSEPTDGPENQPVDRPETDDAEVEPVTVTANTARGDVEITFDVDGVARLSTTDGDTGGSDGAGIGPSVDLVPGTVAGFTLSEDGRLEPVASAEMGDDDFGFRSDRQGVIVDVPGDTPILLRPDGEQGGVSASDVDLGYETIPPDANGEVELADGTTLTPIENPASARVIVVDSDELPWAWVFGTIAVVAVVSALTGYLLHRRRPEPSVTDAGFMVTAGIDTMSDRGFEQFLHELAVDPDPARSVRLGFHAAEQGLGVLPPRKRSETPNEWAARVAANRPELSAPLTTLCDVFARARFGPEPVGEGDCAAVISQLRVLRSAGSDPAPDYGRSESVEAAGVTGTGS